MGGDGKFGAKMLRKDPAKDIRIRFHWPDGVEGEQEELTIAELNAGESTEVITRFATAFNIQKRPSWWSFQTQQARMTPSVTSPTTKAG